MRHHPRTAVEACADLNATDPEVGVDTRHGPSVGSVHKVNRGNEDPMTAGDDKIRLTIAQGFIGKVVDVRFDGEHEQHGLNIIGECFAVDTEAGLVWIDVEPEGFNAYGFRIAQIASITAL